MTGAELLARQARLRAHVESVSGIACQWGINDCSAWAGAWVEKERRINLGLPRYTSEEEARDLIAKAGGLLNIWSRLAGLNGVPETEVPQYGDVGLIETRLGPVGVIMAHDGICAWRASFGVSFIRARTFLKAWSV